MKTAGPIEKITVYMEGNVTKLVNTLYILRKIKDRMKDTGPSSSRYNSVDAGH